MCICALQELVGITAEDLLRYNKDYIPRYKRVADKINRGTLLYCSDIPLRLGGEGADEEEVDEEEDIDLAGECSHN